MTAFDADLNGGGVLKNKVEANSEGIRHNDIKDVLQVDSLSSFWWISFFLPPLAFMIFYFVTASQRLERRDPVKARAIRAYNNYLRSGSTKELSVLESQLRQYFADKLNLVAGAHVISDLKGRVADSLNADEWSQLEQIYDQFDLSHFSSEKQLNLSISQLDEQARKLIKSINGRLAHV